MDAMLGYIESTVDEHINTFIKKLDSVWFSGGDELTMLFEIKTIGNDILAAIGAAKRYREDRGP